MLYRYILITSYHHILFGQWTISADGSMLAVYINYILSWPRLRWLYSLYRGFSHNSERSFTQLSWYYNSTYSSWSSGLLAHIHCTLHNIWVSPWFLDTHHVHRRQLTMEWNDVALKSRTSHLSSILSPSSSPPSPPTHPSSFPPYSPSPLSPPTHPHFHSLSFIPPPPPLSHPLILGCPEDVELRDGRVPAVPRGAQHALLLPPLPRGQPRPTEVLQVLVQCISVPYW